uniref:radixin-like isoform X2 n=1 Tax=Myxine glutinosa TaxID=7769 RepID=UPI00358FCBB5
MPKLLNIRVNTSEVEMNYTFNAGSRARILFDQISNQTNVRGGNVTLNLRVRLFPVDVNEELIMDITQKCFFQQMLESITKDEIFCSAETCVLLGSYASQAMLGPFEEETHKPGYLPLKKLLPQRVLSQYNLTKEQWAERVSNWHRELQDMSREEARMEYLRLCQDLEMFGVTYFSIKNRRGTNLWLGIDTGGLNIYEQDNKLTPKIGFPWTEIRIINYRDKKLIIKPRDHKAPDFVCFASQAWVNKQILELCIGNQQLYVKRHNPDTAEIQQMKVKAKENQNARIAERTRLRNERQRRTEAEEEKKRIEREQVELEQRLKEIEQETERTKRELVEEAKRARELQLESERARKESSRLEEQKRKAERQCTELELIAEERKKGKEELEEEIARHTAQIVSLLDIQREKQEAAEVWQHKASIATEELEKAQKELTARSHSSPPCSPHHSPEGLFYHSPDRSPHHSPDRSPHRSPDRSPYRSPNRSPHGSPDHSPHRSPDRSPHRSPDRSPHRSPDRSPHRSSDRSPHRSPERSPHRSPEHSPHRSPERSLRWSPHHSNSHSGSSSQSFNGAEEAFEREEKTWGDGQLEMEDLQINGEEEMRVTEVEKNERIRQQLLALSAELALSRNSSHLTNLDNAHEEALKKGQDKYKTLQRIRQGNTRQRMDEFESL